MSRHATICVPRRNALPADRAPRTAAPRSATTPVMKITACQLTRARATLTEEMHRTATSADQAGQLSALLDRLECAARSRGPIRLRFTYVFGNVGAGELGVESAGKLLFALHRAA